MKPLASEICKILRRIYSDQNPVFAEIIINWSKIIGVKYSNIASPIKLTQYKNSRTKEVHSTLHIMVPNSAVGTDIYYQQGIILERIAIYFGYKAVNNLKTKPSY